MSDIWVVIVTLGIGTFAVRFAFLGLVGGRALPGWLLRPLRFAPVAILPALVAPMIVHPAATDGALDPARLIAACVALAVGAVFRNVLAAIGSGMVALYVGLWVLG